MERIIITVLRTDENRAVDLELPAMTPVGELLPLLCQELGWPDGSYTLTAQPGQRVVELDETLAAQSIWDGTTIECEQVVETPAARPARQAAPRKKGSWLSTPSGD